MNKWQETVKRVAKQHPGKSLREILPIAKMEYKKMGHVSTGPTKKVKKHRRSSRVRKATRSRKGRKGRKGRKSMRGGTSCGAGGSCAGASCGGGAVGDSTHQSTGMSGSGDVVSAYNSDSDYNGSGSPASVQSGGSHCYPTHMKTPKRRGRGRGRGRGRRSKGRRMRGGEGDMDDHKPAGDEA